MWGLESKKTVVSVFVRLCSVMGQNYYVSRSPSRANSWSKKQEEHSKGICDPSSLLPSRIFNISVRDVGQLEVCDSHRLHPTRMESWTGTMVATT